MADYLTTQAEKDLCREVYDVMDASNLSGVLHFWAERVNPVVLSACRELGLAPNCHPFHRMLSDKLAQLSAGEGVCNDAVIEAYQDVLRVVRSVADPTN